MNSPIRHIGAISGGKDSVAMAVLLKETHPEINFEWVCTPTGNESPEWFAHMRKLRDIIGPISPIPAPMLITLIKKYNALPNWRQRWCTRQIKIEPFAKYLATIAPAKFYIGLRADEEKREGGDYQNVIGVEQIFPLRDAGMGLNDVLEFLATRQIHIPRRTDCMWCFFQRLIEWYELWRDNRQAYLEGEALEIAIGHTFRSPGRDTQPTSLADLRAKFETGWVPRDTRDPINEMKCRVCRL
jgi:hypothetical protein